MKLIAHKLMLSFGALALTACGTLSSNSTYRNSELAYMNPAPETMSPPADLSNVNGVIDDTAKRIQADYHYALGEALSLDEDSDRAIEEFKLATVYDATAAGIRLRLATEYLRKGLLTEAMEQGELARDLEPENTEVRIFLGGLYSALKMMRQASEQYSYVLKKEPNNADVLLYLGAVSSEQERFAEADAYFLRAARIQDNEKKHLAYYYQGKMRASRGSNFFAAAENSFLKALAEDAEFEDGVLALGNLYLLQNQKKKCIQVLEKFQERFGPQKSIAYQLSQVYLDDENYPKALSHLKTLEAFERENLNVKVKIALILIEQKKYEEAIEKLEEIVVMAPTSDKIRFYLAAVYEETNRVNLAISNFKKIESSSTYFQDAIVHTAFLYRKQNQIEEAAKVLREAIRRKDDVPQFYSFYASVLDEMKDFKTGVSMLEGATQKFPEDTQLRFYLGTMYDRVGKAELTIDEMRKILAIDPDYVQAVNYLAYTFADRGQNLEEAEELAYKALKLQPKDPFIMDTVGWVLYKRGQIEESIQYLEAAYKLKPDESVIAEHLGDAYYVFELREKAKQMYIKAVSIENDPSKINKIKAKIASLDSENKNRTPASVVGQ